MVKCKDCKQHDGETNRCDILKSALAFSPDSEVVCPSWKAKEIKQPEGGAEPVG